MAVRVCWCGVFVGILLLGSWTVNCEVTVEVSASQSHPMEGHSIELICRVQSMNQSQVIVWSKDRRSITWGDTMGQMMSSRFELDINGVNTSQGMQTSYVLTINDVTRHDDGSYECEVLQENDGHGYSAMASDTVDLSVLYFPSSAFPYCSLNGSQTLLTGTKLRVACTSEVGNPQIISEWMTGEDTAPLPVYRTVESSRMMVSELELTASHDLQAATYICRVTSEAYPESDRSCSLGPLRIIDWPQVEIMRSLERVTEGSDIHFLCSSDPVMAELDWETIPSIDPDRLEFMDGGAILTVRNVQPGDNMTTVICRVPHRDTYVEARSSIILPANPHVQPPPSFHATSELCVPWFAAFLFTVTINFVLCIIIVRLLMKIKLLTYKLKNSKTAEPGRESVRDVELPSRRSGISKKDSVLTWPASLRSSNSNWSMRSEKELKDQRRQSWVYLSPPDDDPFGPALPEPTTYTELSLDPQERARGHRKKRKTVSLPGIRLSDSDSYVAPAPSTRSKPMHKSASASQLKNYRKSGIAVVKTPPVNTPTSKPENSSKRGGIGSISAKVPIEMSSYMDLDEKTKDSSPQKQTYQALQKTPNSSKYVSKPLKSSLKKKSTSFSMDDMMGDSGIYGGSGSYMKYGGGDMPSMDELSKPAQRQDSMMGESAMKNKRATAQSNRNRRSEVVSSGSSTDAPDSHSGYEVPPDARTTDDGMRPAVYERSIIAKAGGKGPSRGQSRATISSRAPMPHPSARGQKAADSASTNGSYKSPTESNKAPVYFTLESDLGSYTNYGADISSESESYQGPKTYQGPETFDREPANKAAKSATASARWPSSASETSYLELADAKGEINGYMDMTKAKPEQLKTPSTAFTLPRKIANGPPKISKQISQSDSEFSSNEYYQQMEDDERGIEYTVPPSNQLKQVIQESKPQAIGSECRAEKEPEPSSVKHKPKKKGGWAGLFKK